MTDKPGVTVTSPVCNVCECRRLRIPADVRETIVSALNQELTMCESLGNNRAAEVEKALSWLETR